MNQASDSGSIVMVVEDDGSSREVLRQILEDAGYRVACFGGGKEALDALHRVAPRVIVTDLAMPKIDGFELCRRVRADPDFAHVPIIFVSATDALREKLRAFDSGGSDFVDKPVDERVLVDKIAKLLKLEDVRAAMVKRSRG